MNGDNYKSIPDKLAYDDYMSESLDTSKLRNLTREREGYINIDPLQTGGKLYPESKVALQNWGDGYSVCDFCGGRLDEIKNPPIYDFVHDDFPKFLDIDVARVTNGAREGIDIVMHSICSSGDTVVIDKNAHYTTYVAAQRNNLNIKEVLNGGYPEFKIDPEKYAEAIEEVKKATGKLPALTLLTYPDGSYGNLVDAKRVAEISHQYGIPFLSTAPTQSDGCLFPRGNWAATSSSAQGTKAWQPADQSASWGLKASLSRKCSGNRQLTKSKRWSCSAAPQEARP